MLEWIRRHPVLSYCLMVLLPVHLVLWPLRLGGVSVETLELLTVPMGFLPTASAVIVTLIVEGPAGVRQLFLRVWRPRPAFLWIALSLTLFLMLAVLAMTGRYLYSGISPLAAYWTIYGRLEFLLLLPVVLLLPGISEEFGWRGFMQTRLQRQVPGGVACFLVGLTWSGWHAMDFLVDSWPNGPGYWAGFTAYVTGGSMLIGWLFTRSGGNVGIAILAHFGANFVAIYTSVWDLYDGRPVSAFLFVGLIWLVSLLVVWLDPRMRRAEPDGMSERLEPGEDLP
ncbi:hypothetical protein ABI59_11490 [Acidobacteria bacterium Mor1]|nr:hypothetical protein ABI59_11490 [Acidobacteria bacterium Mor1]